MKVKKISKCIIMLLIPLLLGGCFSYQDINKVTFSTSIIFDIDDFGNSVVYLDCIKPYRSTNESSDKGRRIIYKGVGKTSLEALRDINLASSFELNYSQNRAYIFTEKAARNGIRKYLDLINNNQEFQIKPSIFVYFGDIKDLLKVTSSDEEYLGLYLEDLVSKNRKNPRSMQMNINDYLSTSLMANNTNVTGTIEIRDDALDKKIEISGGCVFKDDVLVERIDSKDALSYNLLMDNVRGGTLEMTNPESAKDFITLEILQSKTRSSLKYEGEKLTLIKNIEMKASLGEIQGKLKVDEELLNYIKSKKQQEIKKYLENIFEKYKSKDLDVFDIERLLEVNYPKEAIKDPMKITNLEVNIDLTIDGTEVVKDSL